MQCPSSYLSLVKKFLITQDVKERGELLRFIEPSVATIKQADDLLLNPSLQVQVSHDTSAQILLSENVTSDIELFQNYDGSTEGTVFENLNCNSRTRGAAHFLKTIISTPINDVKLINQRQVIISSITKQLSHKYDDALDTLKEREADVNWLFELKNADTDNQNLNDLYDMVYFRFILLRKFNNIPTAVTGINLYKMFASPAIGILSPVAYFIVPFLIFKWKFGFKIPFKTYMKFMFSTMIQGDLMSAVLLGAGGGGGGAAGFASKGVKWLSFMFSMLFYFQGLFNSVDVARTTYKLAKYLTNKANSIAKALRAADILINDLWTPAINNTFYCCSLESPIVHSKTIPELDNFSVFSNFGKSLAFLKQINYEDVASRIKKAYIIDALYGIARQINQLCFVEFKQESQTQTNTHIELDNAWHICIKSPIANSIKLVDTNMILTGPNAGGKSTFIKTLLINTILAQTLGVACASRAVVSPFDIIHTQINIPDCKGKESLFEAEMYRCKKTLDLCELYPNKRMLIIMDEIFNSTNPVEGIAGAYAVAKKISLSKQVLLIFTTHFIYLTKLHKTGRFDNYRMNVNINTDGSNIQFPYKLSKGVSRQHVALELLRKNGFDADLLNDAIEIKNKLTITTASASGSDK